MKKLTSLGFCTLMAPALALGVGSALAQEQEPRTNPEVAQSQQRANPTTPGSAQAQQQRANAERAQSQRSTPERAQSAHAAESTPILSKPADAFLSEDLIGSALMSRQNQNFGPINDFIVDSDGQILAVIVGVGGFLGVGERDVAIAWDSLESATDEDGDLAFHVDMTDAALRATPEYETD